MARATSSPNPDIPGTGRRVRGVDAVGGSGCRAAQSLRRSAGSIRIAAQAIGVAAVHSGRRARLKRIGAIRGGDGEDGVLI